jgi:hypothetical protein
VVDPNAAQTCDLVTFQRYDRPFIEARKEKHEDELLSYIAPVGASTIRLHESGQTIKFSLSIRTVPD